jgi:hypothetical protein
LATSRREKIFVYAINFEMKKKSFLKFELKFFVFEFEKNWPYHQKEMEKTDFEI